MFDFQEKEKTIPQSQIKKPSPQEKMAKVPSQEFSPSTLENTENYVPSPQHLFNRDEEIKLIEKANLPAFELFKRYSNFTENERLKRETIENFKKNTEKEQEREDRYKEKREKEKPIAKLKEDLNSPDLVFNISPRTLENTENYVPNSQHLFNKSEESKLIEKAKLNMERIELFKKFSPKDTEQEREDRHKEIREKEKQIAKLEEVSSPPGLVFNINPKDKKAPSSVQQIKDKAEKLKSKSKNNSQTFMNFLEYCSLLLNQSDDLNTKEILKKISKYSDLLILDLYQKEDNSDQKKILAIQLKDLLNPLFDRYGLLVPEKDEPTDFDEIGQQLFKSPLSSNQKLRKKVLKIKQKAEKLQDKSSKNSDSFMQFLGYCSLFLDQPDDYFMPDLLKFIFQYCDELLILKDSSTEDFSSKKKVLASQLKEVLKMQMAPMTSDQRLALLPHNTDIGKAKLSKEEKKLADEGDKFLTEDLYFTDDYRFVNDRLKNPDEYKSLFAEMVEYDKSSDPNYNAESFNKSVRDKILQNLELGSMHYGKAFNKVTLSRSLSFIDSLKSYRESIDKDHREGKNPEETEVYKMFADLNCGQKFIGKNDDKFCYREKLEKEEKSELFKIKHSKLNQSEKDQKNSEIKKYYKNKKGLLSFEELEETTQRNKQGLLKLKDIYFKQMLYIENKYGKFFIEMHPLDLVSRSGTDFSKEILFVQDCVQMLDIPDLFDISKKEDRQFIAMCHYLGSILAYFINQYNMANSNGINETMKQDKEDKKLRDLLGKDLKSFFPKSKADNPDFGIYIKDEKIKSICDASKLVEQEGIPLKGFTPEQQKQYNASLKRRGLDKDFNLLDETKTQSKEEINVSLTDLSKKVLSLKYNSTKNSKTWQNLERSLKNILSYNSLANKDKGKFQLLREFYGYTSFLKDLNYCIYTLSAKTDSYMEEKKDVAIQFRVALTPLFQNLGIELNPIDN